MTIFLKTDKNGLDNIIYRNIPFCSQLRDCIYKETGIFTKNVLGKNEDEFYLCSDNDNQNNEDMEKVKIYLKEVFNINSKDADNKLITFGYNIKWATNPISFKLSDYEMDQCKALLKLKGY